MSRMRSAPLPGTQVDPLYPDSDGRPMGDTDFHTQALVWLRDALQDYYAEAPDVYIASNIVMYYQQGEPRRHRDPDGLVAKGVVGKHPRRSFRLWEEKVVPCVLFEIASRDTWRVDLKVKPIEYAGLGVKEYFVFDPEGIYLSPVLQGFRTVKGKPVAMRPATDGSLVSKQMGLRLVPEGPMLRLIDQQTGERILTRNERNERSELRAEQERQRAEALEAEVRRLRARLEEHEGDNR